MSKTTYAVNSFANAAKDQATRIGGEFKGGVIHISVEVGEAIIRQRDIKNAIASCPSIPSEWYPDVHNNLTLYFQTISEMKRAGIKNFIVPTDINFDVEIHAGYTVDKVMQNVHDKFPTCHKVFRKTRASGKAEDSKTEESRNITDIKMSEGIIVMLERTKGTVKDDETGDSEFDLVIDTTVEGQDVDEYIPFIETLKTRFMSKINGVYDSRQIRDILLKIVRQDIEAISIQTGLYFVGPSKIDPVYELAEAMQKVHAGIRIQVIPIIEYKDAPLFNKHVDDVKISLTDSIISDFKTFNKTITEMAQDMDTNIREATWLKKLSELRKYKDLLTELKEDNMIKIDILQDLIDETEEIITDKV